VTTGGFVVPEDYLKIASWLRHNEPLKPGFDSELLPCFSVRLSTRKPSMFRTPERGSVWIHMYRVKKLFWPERNGLKGRGLECSKRLLTPEKRMGSPMPEHGFKAGDKINWSYEPRGGYGYTQGIAGVVNKLGREKVQIRVAKRDNGSWVTAERWVVPEKVSRRVTRAVPEEACAAHRASNTIYGQTPVTADW